MPQKLIFCRSKVKKSNIRRESRDGVEHVIISSFTLPPDIVMNGGLYPANEIDKSYMTLDRTLAPVEHPQINGQYLSATDPIAINEYYAGAHNENPVKGDDGRIMVDKVINVSEALKTDRGKRLLDRINGIEDGTDSRPIHTSVGVFVEVETLDEPKTNAAGDKYDWIAKEMIFDHDAILLDSIGAATPSKGVGIGINHGGDDIDVEFVTCETDEANDLRTNKERSFSEINGALHEQINRNAEQDGWSFIVDIFDDSFVYETPSGEMFRSNYLVDEQGNISIQDTRLPVERVVEYRPINKPTDEEGETMRDAIIAKLKELGIEVNSEISDDELQAKYEEALTANNGDDTQDNGDLAAVVANAVKSATGPLVDKIDSLEKKVNKKDDDELERLTEQVVNSNKYEGLDKDTIKALGLEKVRSMAANCQTSFGLGSTMHVNDGSDDSESYDMPE